MERASSPGRATTVGRERELTQIEAALDALGDGEARFLTFEGEAGIGKTRLLEELRRRGEDRGCIVLSGAAAEFERELPFSVWVDALDAYVVSQDFASHAAWDAALAEELAQVLPSLGGSEARASALPDERYRAHRAVARLLALIAEPQPLVVILDDLHWSDGASLELIAALARRSPTASVLLALGFRPGPAAQRLAGPLTAPTVTRLDLAQLGPDEARQLLDGLDPAAVAAAYSHGGGNPFYLEQLGRAAQDGDLAASHGRGEGNGGVPPAVAGAIAGELAALEEAPRRLLEAAAVAGEPFEPDLAGAIADVETAQALDALDDLLDLDLVRPTQVPRRFTFRHPLVRRAVYDSSRAGWRLAAHARAAELLAARGAQPSERAHHVEQSAGQGDEAAIELLLEAGRSATGRAPEVAAGWFEAALRLLPSGDTDRQVTVRVALASALRSLGELERSRTTLLEAIDLLPPNSVVRRVELTTRCAAVEHWQGRHDEAHVRLRRAWDEVPDRSTPAAAALQIELSIDGLYERDFEQTLEMGRGARETAQALGDDALIAAAVSALCLGEAAVGDIAAAKEHRAEAVEYVDRLSDAELAPRLEALYYLGWAENYLEHYDEAIAHADRGIEIARSAGQGRLLLPLMLLKGYPFEIQGRMNEALEVTDAAVEAARLSGNPHNLSWALFELAWAHYYRGNLDEAVDLCEESHRVGGRLAGSTMPAASGGPGWPLASALFERGDIERGLEVVEAIGGGDLEHAIPVERCFYWEELATVEIARSDLHAAARYVELAEEQAARLGLSLPTALARRGRAALLLASGDAVGAAAAGAQSAEELEALGARLPAAYALMIQGKALSAQDKRPEAVAVLRQAEEALDRCRSLRVRDEARRELRKLGARAEVRGPATEDDSGIGSLTKRELEIAELVTDRLTNPQIADKLFLSKKTIETHIRNIFVKLGASSRVEVARIVEQDRRERPGLVDAP